MFYFADNCLNNYWIFLSSEFCYSDYIFLDDNFLSKFFKWTWRLNFLVKTLSQWLQTNLAKPQWIISLCLSKLPFCENFMSHWSHSYGFSPVWVLKWSKYLLIENIEKLHCYPPSSLCSHLYSLKSRVWDYDLKK